jgi:hypothetical protein
MESWFPLEPCQSALSGKCQTRGNLVAFVLLRFAALENAGFYWFFVRKRLVSRKGI